MKKVSLFIVFLVGVFSLSAQEESASTQSENGMRTDAHASNFRSWSIGLNVGPTASLGDQSSYFFGDKGDNVPNGIGGFEIGVRGHLTKFITPSFGLSGTAGYHTVSGTSVGRYFDGNFIDGDISMVFNLSNMFVRGITDQRKNALLFHIGLGITSYDAQGYDAVTRAQTVDLKGDDRALQTTLPLKLHYKRYLSETWDLDIFYKHFIMPEDWVDTYEDGATTDMIGYLGLGVSYNFGEDGKKSIVYSNPLDDMYGDIQTIREDYNKLTGDDDMDGVANYYDQESSTPEGVAVTGAGIALDSDDDGIPNYLDEDPFTRKGAQVDAQGRAIDSDDDGIADTFDEEANTPAGALVNRKGQEVKFKKDGGATVAVLPSIFFPFNSANIMNAYEERLASIALAMKHNPDISIKLVGHADVRGPEQYNMKLAQRRAEAVKSKLIQVFGIDGNRIEVVSEGASTPLAQPRENYSLNRRVDVIPQ